jgi:hypothetical protein
MTTLEEDRNGPSATAERGRLGMSAHLLRRVIVVDVPGGVFSKPAQKDRVLSPKVLELGVGGGELVDTGFFGGI